MSIPEDIKKNYEWCEVEPGNQFFDQLEKRLFINFTKSPLKIGFSHNARRIEMIAITDGVKKDPELKALQGTEIVEE